MNKNYEWNETNTGITISVPLLYKIDKKQIDYTITEAYVKLNLHEMKQLYFIDLAREIDIETSKMVLEENKIIFNLTKKENGLWKGLESKLPKPELKERRKQAEKKLEESISQKRELAQKKKNEFEKFVVDQSIKIDDNRREEIRSKKRIEKTNAEKDLYKFVDKMDNNLKEENDEDDKNEKDSQETENTNKNSNNTNNANSIIENINRQYEEEKNQEEIEHQQDLNQNQDKEKTKEEKNEKEKESFTKHKIEEDPYEEGKDFKQDPIMEGGAPVRHNIESRRNQIFNENNIKKKSSALNNQYPLNHIPQEKQSDDKPLVINSPMVNENNFQNTLRALVDRDEKKKESPKPEPANIRKHETIKVNLTKKMIPTFAARESLAKEPPYPKSKKYVPEKNYLGQEIDEKNPIWAKQRGDNFYNNKDYRSAINAYSNSLSLDPQFHKVLINRGTCYMCLGEFDLALEDFNHALNLIESIDKKERSDAFYDRVVVRALSKIYAVYALRQDYQQALNVINNKLLLKEHAFPFIIPDDMWKKIEKDKEIIEQRMRNEKLKEEADKALKEQNIDMAEKIYKDILAVEPNNERVLSNLSLIYYAQGKYDEVIDLCNKILNVFVKFREKIKIKNMNNSFEIKVLLRRATCYEKKNEMPLAQKDVEAIEKLEITNPNVLKEVKGMKDKLKIHVVDSYKQSANQHLAKGEFAEALDYYNKAIDVVKFSNIYNKIDLVKILLNRISCLVKLTQYDNTYLEFERILNILSKQKAIADLQSNLILADQVKELEFLSLVKRAHVYVINNKIEDAINDYNKALIIKPGDIKIKENLTKLKAL